MKCLNQSQHTCVIKIQIGWVISCESTVLVYTAIQFIKTCRFRFSTTNSKPNHKIIMQNMHLVMFLNQHIFLFKQYISQVYFLE